jgi:Putative Flp pilus-assembly TadE/G-like
MQPPDMTTRAANAHPERGQTIAIVAAAMMGVLIMAALAIDLTTLYVAHGEIQRAADAAALAGAKAFVDSGMTTATTNPSQSNLQALATAMAGDYAKAVAAQNNVAGAPATFIAAQINTGAPGNPTIQVTLQRTGLPLFFARIWGTVASVSATAIAEAYNPAYSQAIPPAPKCVKPFLVPNADQNQGGIPFVDPTTGAIKPAPLPFIGETITLTSACGPTPGVCSPSGPPWTGKYLPMLLPDTHRYCPGCVATGNFERSTECCDGIVFSYSQCGVPGSSGSVPVGTWDQSPPLVVGGTNGQAQNGLQCLIHAASIGAPGGNPQQDTLNTLQANTGLLQINPGTYSQTHYGVGQGSVISTSGSIITVPLFDPSSWSAGNPQVTVVGFLQLFVNYAGPTLTGPPAIVALNGDMNATILNVVGCGNSLGATAISGGGASAIPVRLIHN